MASIVERARAAFSVRYNAAAFRRAIRVEVEVPITTVGDLSYGGYAIPAQLLDADSVLVSIGAGTDVSFELAVAQRFGCRAFIYDPVPASATFTEKAIAHEPRISYERLAVWNEDTDLDFHAPLQEGFVSHSATDMHNTPVSFTAPARTLSTLASTNGWTHIDLLKVSAEGSEFAILDHALASGLEIRAIAVEWAQPVELGRVIAAVADLHRAGFRNVAVSGRPRNHKMTLLRGDVTFAEAALSR
jgi:FkbM family methyltransferase